MYCFSGIVSLGLDNKEKQTPLQKSLDFEKKTSRICICLHCSSGIDSLGLDNKKKQTQLQKIKILKRKSVRAVFVCIVPVPLSHLK